MNVKEALEVISKAATACNPATVRIVIGQRNWIWVGRYHKDGDEVVLTDAWCIRRWGTTSGLGQLCSGPVPGKTVLDKVPYTVRLHVLSVVATYDADERGWYGNT